MIQHEESKDSADAFSDNDTEPSCSDSVPKLTVRSQRTASIHLKMLVGTDITHITKGSVSVLTEHNESMFYFTQGVITFKQTN